MVVVASTSTLNDGVYESSTTLPTTNALQFHPNDDKYTTPYPMRQPTLSGTVRTMNRVDLTEPAPVMLTQREPIPIAPMQVAIHPHLNTLGKPYDRNAERSWSYGLCDCCSSCSAFGTCCVATWCPCIIYGQNKTRLESLDKYGVPDPAGGNCCGRDSWCYFLLYLVSYLGWVLSVSGVELGKMIDE